MPNDATARQSHIEARLSLSWRPNWLFVAGPFCWRTVRTSLTAKPKHAFIPWCQRKFNTFRCIPGYSEWAEQLADANWPAWWATQHPSRRVCTASAGRSLESLVLCGLCVRVVDVGCRLIIYGEHWGAAEQSFALFWFGFSTLLAIEWHECSHVALFPSFCFNRLSLCTIQFEDSKPCQTMPHNVKPKIKPL